MSFGHPGFAYRRSRVVHVSIRSKCTGTNPVCQIIGWGVLIERSEAFVWEGQRPPATMPSAFAFL
jgi:hypothetical protein